MAKTKLKLRTILALCYTITFAFIIGFAFYIIYLLSEGHRKEQFSLRLKDRILTTFRILLDVEQIDREVLQVFDKNTINTLSEEKILLFDASGKVIYNSIDDTPINYPSDILKKLRGGANDIRFADGRYELVGISFNSNNNTYYGIGKAHDRYGKSKLQFLKYVFILAFSIVTLLLIILSLVLARIITAPITALTRNVEQISPNDLSMRVYARSSTQEVNILAGKFNDLLNKVENAFKFQTHFIHHISHELKTPLAVMIANVERTLAEGKSDGLKDSLDFQRGALMDLSGIINAMMDISKTEHQVLPVQTDVIRLDELLFECMDELNFLYNQVQFDFKIDTSIEHSDSLTLHGNSRMLKMAFMNLLKNAILYTKSEMPIVELISFSDFIKVNIINDGATIEEGERPQLFHHLFRGTNSAGVKGFGLGLVLTKRIIKLHQGIISYQILPGNRNCFAVELPLFA